MLFFKDINIPGIKNPIRIYLYKFITFITFSVIGPMLIEVRTLFNMYLYLIPFPLKINGVLMYELHDFYAPQEYICRAHDY